MANTYQHIAEHLLDDEEGNVPNLYRCTEGHITGGRGVNIETLPKDMLEQAVLTVESIETLNRLKTSSPRSHKTVVYPLAPE